MTPTSVEGLVGLMLPFRPQIGVGLVLLPLMALILGTVLRAMSTRLCAWFLSVCICLSVLPGIFDLSALTYLHFFTHTNLVRELDVLLYFGPVMSMLATLLASSKVLPLSLIPGMSKLMGLGALGGLGFLGGFLLTRTQLITWLHIDSTTFMLMLLGGAIVAWVAFATAFGGSAKLDEHELRRLKRT